MLRRNFWNSFSWASAIKIKLDGIEQNAIIDIRHKEQIIITGADNNELIQIGTTELIITINTLKY